MAVSARHKHHCVPVWDLGCSRQACLRGKRTWTGGGRWGRRSFIIHELNAYTVPHCREKLGCTPMVRGGTRGPDLNELPDLQTYCSRPQVRRTTTPPCPSAPFIYLQSIEHSSRPLECIAPVCGFPLRVGSYKRHKPQAVAFGSYIAVPLSKLSRMSAVYLS